MGERGDRLALDRHCSAGTCNANGTTNSISDSCTTRAFGKILLPSVILETKTFNEQIRSGNLNPFD